MATISPDARTGPAAAPMRAREIAGVAAAFVAIAVAATWPLVLHLRNTLPSDVGDPVLNAWILGWDALRLRHGLAHLWDAPNFFPYRDTLAYSDHLLGVAIFTAPVQWLTGNPVLTYDVAYIASWALSGIGMYVLARSLTARRDAAWFAAAAYAFSPVRMGHLSHLQWLLVGWLPLSLWALHRYFRTGSWRFAFASAAFFLLQATTASYFMYFALVPIGCVAVVELRRTAVPVRRIAVHAAIVAVALAAAIGPIALHYYAVRRQQGLHRTVDDVRNNSANLADYGKASQDMRIWRVLPPGGSEHEVFPGVLPVLFAGVALVAARRRSPAVATYAVVAAIAFLLSLGPAPAIGSRELPFAGPYRLLLAIVPGLDGLRAPGRLAIVVALALAVMAAFGVAWVIDRTPARRRSMVTGLLIAGAIAEGWIAPVRLATFDPAGPPRDRAAYEYLRALPPGGVLELPILLAEPLYDFRYEYMTLVHGHPVVNGHSGYQSPLLEFLGSSGSPFYDFDRLDAAFRMASAIGIRYIVVHRGYGDGDLLADALGRAAAADRARVVATRDFGTALVISVASESVPAAPPASAIPVEAVRGTASHNPDRLGFAFDGDLDSRWLSGVPQAGNEWVRLDLDRERDVAVVRLRLAERSFGDYPRHLTVDVTEARGVRTVYDGTVLPQLARGLLANGSYPAIDIVLPPNRARSITLRQTGSAHAFFWSIHELRLLERQP